MPRVVPSQVVSYLEATFPITKEKRYSKVELNPQSIIALRTILEMCQEIPDELITLEGPGYVDYRTGLTGLRTEIEDWSSRQERRGRNLSFVPGKDQITPLDLILQTLLRCADATPSPQTKGLGFIEDDLARI